MTVSCSFCPRKFDNLQQLGGHQTRHREEMNVLRKKHEEQMKMEREKNRRQTIKMVVLPPNPAFWVMYRKYGIEPKVREFIPVVKEGGELSRTTKNSETSKGVDLTLKL